jgi:hypothetical protein
MGKYKYTLSLCSIISVTLTLATRIKKYKQVGAQKRERRIYVLIRDKDVFLKKIKMYCEMRMTINIG